MFPAFQRSLLVALAAGVALMGGCRGIPRIDPSGERFLLWPDRQPGVALPQGPLIGPPAVDTSGAINPYAAAGAITPPPGNITAPPVYSQQMVNGVPVAAQPIVLEPQDRLQLTPQRVLAPVGSEVVLKAGVCATSGYLMTNRRIDWTVDKRGVGQIVEVGEEGEHDIMRWPWQKAKKVDSSYAVGYASPVNDTLQRNLADPLDDVQIRPGESWVSITSPADGTSYITAYAPSVGDWAGRTASTVIYWIDAQWQTPPSQTVEAGQPHLLTTTVTRQSDGAPLEGWIVRYDVADGSGAQLGYNAQQTAEATTDGSGRANVEVTPTDNGTGMTTIRTTIIRPAQAGIAASPRLDVGSGITTLQWAPGAGAPPSGLPPVVPPADDGFLPPTPPPGDDVVVPPNETGRPDLVARLRQETPGPIRVGDAIAYTVLVQNNGTATARNIRIVDRFDAGMANQYDDRGVNEVEYTAMSDLAPGESDSVVLEFDVLEPGQRSHEVTVTAEGATEAFDRATFEALPLETTMPELRVNITGDVRPIVNTTTTLLGVVENTGTTPATNVVVTIRHGQGLRPVNREPTREGESAASLADGVQWTLPRLEPGAKRTLRLQCECVSPQVSTYGRIFATADGGAERAEEYTFEILPPSPADNGGGTPALDVSPLGLSISSAANPAKVGRSSVLTVYLTNNAGTPQRQVQVRVRVPAGYINVRQQEIQSPVQFRMNNGVLEFAPIPELNAGLPQTILIPYDAVQAGRVELQGAIQSAENPRWSYNEQPLVIDPR